jgi:hypothetical protein
VYTPLLTIDDVTFSTFYMANITGISINGTTVSIPIAPFEFNATTRSGATVFDSGTSLLVFSEDIYAPIVNHVIKVVYVSVHHTCPSRPKVYPFDMLLMPKSPPNKAYVCVLREYLSIFKYILRCLCIFKEYSKNVSAKSI